MLGGATALYTIGGRKSIDDAGDGRSSMIDSARRGRREELDATQRRGDRRRISIARILFIHRNHYHILPDSTQNGARTLMMMVNHQRERLGGWEMR